MQCELPHRATEEPLADLLSPQLLLLHALKAFLKEAVRVREVSAAQHVARLADVDELRELLKQPPVSARQLHERRDVVRHGLPLLARQAVAARPKELLEVVEDVWLSH